MSAQETLRRAGLVIAATWIFGGSAFFFVRFTAVFYLANRPAIERALVRLLDPLF